MTFRTKVLKFTAAAIESNEKPKLPELPTGSKNQYAIKSREVAFGKTLPVQEGEEDGEQEPVNLVDNIEQEMGANDAENDIEVSNVNELEAELN